MGESLQFIDIIFFAMIAAFLVLRLRNVLGRRDGHKGAPQEPIERSGLAEENDKNVVPPKEEQEHDTYTDLVALEGEKGLDPLGMGLNEIRSFDSSFTTQEFVSGGRIAFEIILSAYSGGNSDALKPLLSNDVFANFDHAIRERESIGETIEETLISIKTADVVEAYMEGSLARITVKFVSEQVHAIRNKNGDITDGDPNIVTEAVDLWTFSDDMKITNPNWLLVATRSLD